MFLTDFLSKLSDLGKKIFYVTVIVVMLFLFDFLFVRPFSKKIQNIETKIVQQNVIIDQDKKFLSYRDKISQEHKVFSKYISSSIIDENQANNEFFKVVEKIASNNNVNLVKSNPSETKKKDNLIEYYANLDCTGTLKDMISFMYNINTSNDLLKVIKFNLTPKRGQEDEVTASFTVVQLIINPIKSK